MTRADFTQAQKNKNDEFYTQLPDINNELCHYREFFKNKIVFCNCDDPFESNFFKYFALNFNFLGLKKLICTCYADSPISHTEFSDSAIFYEGNTQHEKLPYMIEITEVKDFNGDGAEDMDDIELLLRDDKNTLTLLDGDGDFRSEESIGFLEEADVVVTNPPFSLFREFVAQLIKYDKKFLIIGNNNAITYKEIFPLIKENKIWLGYGVNQTFEFRLNEKYDKWNRIENGVKYGKVPAISWFTNIDTKKRHEDIILYKKYNQEEYPKYDNYDAINVDKTANIPCDYNGIMGVPITFLNKYNPEQFEIIGLGNSRDNFTPNKNYLNPIKHLKNGQCVTGGAINCVLTLKEKEKPINQIYYSTNNEPYLVAPYARILIKRKEQ